LDCSEFKNEAGSSPASLFVPDYQALEDSQGRMNAGLPRVEFEMHGRIAPEFRNSPENRAKSSQTLGIHCNA
jgi:hypothetical protein